MEEPSRREDNSPQSKIPNLPVPDEKIIRAFALFILILCKSWMYMTGTAVIFTVIFIVFGGWFSFLFLLICVPAILYNTEDKLVYLPDVPKNSRTAVLVPEFFKLPYETVYIRSIDGTLLHGFFIRQPEPHCAQAPTVLFLHGNAGNIGNRLPNASKLFKLLGVNILLLEYRGFGLSKGRPSERGFYADARAALNYLHSRNDINRNEIVVFGRSLGGAVAIDVACCPEYSPKIWCVIVENTFSSVPDMASILIGSYLRFLPLWFHKNKFLSLSKMKGLRIPALFISGLSDAVVPSTMMDSLYTQCASSLKVKLVFPHGTHNETWQCSGYYSAWKAFFDKIRSTEASVADKSTARSQPVMHSLIELV